MANNLEELIALKQRKQIALLHKKESIKELNAYFEEHKYSILWAYLNPLKDSTKSKINTYLQIAESLFPSQISGLKLMETEVAKSSAKNLGMVLGRTLLNLLAKRIGKRKEKKKKKAQKEVKIAD